ncbi:thioredoxin-like [Montipora foliosa]|uniref:thioredoxin-like n=1 Tax=Montipora foliosa TaxID=591990 RepID=UPI0035F14A97
MLLTFSGEKAAYDDIIEKNKDKLVVMDFFAEWCGPCRKMKPYLRRLIEEYPDVIFVKIDVDENDEISELENVEVMPTFVFYKNGEKVSSFSGGDKDQLEEKIRALRQT